MRESPLQPAAAPMLEERLLTVPRWRVVNHAVDYAHDLAKIPEYQRERPTTAPQSSPTQQEGTDTTSPPVDAPEGSTEGK